MRNALTKRTRCYERGVVRDLSEEGMSQQRIFQRSGTARAKDRGRKKWKKPVLVEHQEEGHTLGCCI